MKIVEAVRERERENAKGVTLIALVITIIVLLILAGVVLNTVLGNDGIIAKAQLAREKTNQAQREEQEKLNELENELANYSTRTNNNNLASTTIYPEGTETEPPTINISDRIEIDNPYPGHKIYTRAEIKIDDTWGETGWVYLTRLWCVIWCKSKSVG